MINVLADQYLYNIQSYLPESVNLQLFDPAQGLPSEVEQAHAMLIRTVIPINKQTLPNIPKNLTFIGTGSSGTDHVDSQYLGNHNIHFADAAGCNARSVAEYIATALLLWSEKRNKDLSTVSVGIIGVGHVGTKVADILKKVGLQTVTYDPPRDQRDSGFTTASLEEALSCDILSFHTPLNKKGKYPTYHWLDQRKLEGRTFDLIINSARGGVVDERALLNTMKQGKIRDIIIDVWENEPDIHLDTAGAAFLKTPHIAGYSIQAKENASKFIADDLIDHFDLERPQIETNDQKIIFDKRPDEFTSLSSLLIELHPIKNYEQQLTEIVKNHPHKRGEMFNKLRAEFPLRQQFAQIHLTKTYFKQFPILKELGFSEIS
ncbi:4-phosphoerythronate dehydrogenase [Fodinibius sp.]|uniref:4-phosphoerythronate dehydrogenase n=1 Tax=Fodinibius sp. TaxID=1872440 RepID=UPI002ACD9DE2|nr:4-phosphoerythronate dehydrogenase [Fodinibius sp.]MDZ7658454.1 4-phosphoerythronate dehydrogenase [Fodinibius sp.]